MVLVVDLHAGETGRGQRRQTVGVQRVVPVPPGPRVRDHADPAGCGDRAHHRHQVGGIAVHVRRPLRTEEPVEGLGPVAHHALCHQRIGDVRSTHRRRVPGQRTHLVDLHLDAERAQPLQRRGQPGVAPVQDPLQLRDQVGMVRVREVGEQVHPGAGVPAADLDAAHQAHGLALGGLRGLRPPLGGVVVGQPEHVDPGRAGVAHQLGRRRGAVRAIGVGVEVDAHEAQA